VTVRVLTAFAGFAVALVLALASIPFMVVAAGAYVMGDDELADRADAAMPFLRYLNRRGT
jgi:hypothetical protein